MTATRTRWVIVMMLVVMVWVMARRRCAMAVMAWVTVVIARLWCRTMRLVTGVVVRLMLRIARFLAVVIMLVAVVARFRRLVVSV